MPIKIIVSLLLLFPVVSVACSGKNLKEKIENCLDNVTITKGPTFIGGAERFELTITQPTDHANPQGETFEQRLVLTSFDEENPMSLVATGYMIFGVERDSGIQGRTKKLNRLMVEHRYFASSTPKSKDWSFLNIRQSADDFHNVVVQFKKIYKSNWVNYGASKGGMTSVYHRRFYPDDVNGTIAYVAPLSFSPKDERYIKFLKNVGGSTYSWCRERLRNMRREVLKRRSKMLPKFSGPYTRFGGKEQALEVAAADSFFAFFQYKTAAECASVPTTTASDSMLYRAFDRIADMSFYNDTVIDQFSPYFYQAATELGQPAYYFENLSDMIQYPKAFNLDKVAPIGADLTYNPKAMRDIDRWVQEKSEGIMYVNGEFDPWTAGAFRLGSSVDRDSHYFVAPEGHHGTKVPNLDKEDREQALKILSRWYGTDIVVSQSPLDSVETLDRRWGLRP